MQTNQICNYFFLSTFKKMSKMEQKLFFGIGIDFGIGIGRQSQLGIEEIETFNCLLIHTF